jgi:methionine synthase II (cobalamin-independent)
MAMTMTLAHGAHLVGGLAAPTSSDAMTTAARILGRHLTRLTDGETGARSQWIWWQIDKLTAIPGVRMGAPHVNPETGNPDYSVFPGLDVDEGIVIPQGALGYAEEATASYATFVSLRSRGLIDDAVRFQVSVPTPFAVVVAWSNGPSQTNLWQPFKDALFAEVRAIQAAIPAEDLTIQWDVAVEVGVLEGVFTPVDELRSFERIVDELVDALEVVSPPTERGLHLCYGDYKHRHFTPPTDLGLLVRLTNAVAERTTFDFVHMPVDREHGVTPAYFDALRDLRVGDAELALGVIDYENDPKRIDQLVAAADSAGRTYAVATECGMARLGERGETVSLTDLLEQHARVASPVR